MPKTLEYHIFQKNFVGDFFNGKTFDNYLLRSLIKIICEEIKKNLTKNSSLIVITHYPKILTYLIPNYVHIMIEGKIVKSGNIELVNYLEEKGYQDLKNIFP